LVWKVYALHPGDFIHARKLIDSLKLLTQGNGLRDVSLKRLLDLAVASKFLVESVDTRPEFFALLSPPREFRALLLDQALQFSHLALIHAGTNIGNSRGLASG